MLREEQLQLKEFFVEGKRQEQSYVLLHISDPSTREEKHKGHLFILYEASGIDQSYIQNLQKLIEQTGNAYYKSTGETNEQCLEIALGILNNQAEHLLDTNKTIHCVVGVITPDELLFSFSNQPHVLLYYKNKQGHYQTMDLVKNNTNALEQPSDTKKTVLFSQIIQGKLGTEDILLLATHEVVKHINPEYLKYTITSKPTEDACQIIETILIKSRGPQSFGGLIIQHNQERLLTPIPKTPPHQGSEKSLQNFFATEKNTAQTLSSSLGRGLAQRIGSHIKPSSQTSTNFTTTHPARQSFFNSTRSSDGQKPVPKHHHSPLSMLYALFKKIFSTITTIIIALLFGTGSVLKGMLVIITNSKGRRKETWNTWQKQWRGYTENLKQLPIITKLLLLSSIILGVVFIVSISFIRIQSQKNQVEKNYQNQLKAAQTSKIEAESTFLYDEKTAQQKLADAEALLAKLPCTTPEQKKACDELKKGLEDIALKLKKMTVVSPELLYAWPDQTNYTLEGLVKIKNKLLSFSSQKNSISVFDLTTREIHDITNTTTDTGFIIASVPKENDYTALLTKNNELLQFNPIDETLKKTDLSFPEENSTITSMVVYNRNLYSLDPNHNQIYRHDATAAGFARGKPWIKDMSVGIQDGTSLTIDGDLFVLKKNGQIVKLNKGTAQSFSIQGLNPPLSNPQKMWTYNELKYIYILDSTEKRLIALTKDGTLVSQFTSPEFKSLRDMVIDEENKIAYILDSNRIFKLTLPI